MKSWLAAMCAAIAYSSRISSVKSRCSAPWASSRSATLHEVGDFAPIVRSSFSAHSDPSSSSAARMRSEEHTSELQSLMRISYAVFCLKKTKENQTQLHQLSPREQL